MMYLLTGVQHTDIIQPVIKKSMSTFTGVDKHMAYLLSVLGLALILEGIPYFVFPEKMKSLMEHIQKMPSRPLRMFGSIAMGTGLFLVYIAQNYLR
jgi:uncharacterized protein YjeT (DUF2065 family)